MESIPHGVHGSGKALMGSMERTQDPWEALMGPMERTQDPWEALMGSMERTRPACILALVR